MTKVLVWVEHDGTAVKDATLSAVTAAAQLGEVIALVAGSGVAGVAQAAAQIAGVTTVLVTHDQEEALSIADRVAVMHGGRLLQVASPATIYRQPADGFVARFIGAGAVLDGITEQAGVRVGQMLFPAAAAAAHSAGKRVELFLRPEHVRVAATAGDGTTPTVAAEVREVTFLGAQTRLRMAVAGDNALWADMASEQAEAFKPGDPVFASWEIGAPRLMPV